MYLYFDKIDGKKKVSVISKDININLGEDYVEANIPENGIGDLCIDDNNKPYYDNEPKTEVDRLKLENKELKKDLEEKSLASALAQAEIFEALEKAKLETAESMAELFETLMGGGEK